MALRSVAAVLNWESQKRPVSLSELGGSDAGREKARSRRGDISVSLAAVSRDAQVAKTEFRSPLVLWDRGPT